MGIDVDERADWTERAIAWANKTLFGGELPAVVAHWALTPYGACIGYTRIGRTLSITLHPAAFGKGTVHAREMSPAWGGTPACKLYALDLIVHELVHVQLREQRAAGRTSHDNEWWPAEIERLSPLIGLRGVVASRTKRARSKEDGRMLRVPAKPGAISMAELARWPHSLRSAAYYRRSGTLPV